MPSIKVQLNTSEAIDRIKRYNLLAIGRIKDEVSATSEEIVTDSKKKLTTDKHIDTGRLRASIGILFSRRDGLGTEIGSDVHYADKIEKLDSYLFYAFEKNRQGFIKRISKIVNG